MCYTTHSWRKREESVYFLDIESERTACLFQSLSASYFQQKVVIGNIRKLTSQGLKGVLGPHLITFDGWYI